MKQLEEQDDPDGTLFQAVRGRLSEIAAERERKLAKLAEVSEPLADDDNAVELLDALGGADAETLRSVSDDVLRRLFDAFRLTVTYDGRTGRALCRAVVSDDTLPAIQAVLDAIANPGPTSAQQARQAWMCVCVRRPRQGDGDMGTRHRRSRWVTASGSFPASKPRRQDLLR